MVALTIKNLENGKLDLDHVADLVNSSARVIKDRFGHDKMTMAGAIDTLRAFVPRGEFRVGTAYAMKDIYAFAGMAYVVLVAHVSTSVAVDLAAARIALHQGLTIEALAAESASAKMGHTNRQTLEVDTVKKELDRMASRNGRIDASSFPRLFDAIRKYRLGDPAQGPIKIAIHASSLGNGPTLPNPGSQAPGNDFVNRLKQAIDPSGMLTFEVRNYSADGSVVSDWIAPGGSISAMEAGGFTPHLVYLIPGMNDFATAQYNSGQGFQGFQVALGRLLLRLKNVIGSDVLLTTSPHPAVNSVPSLNSLGAGLSQVYPTAIAAPVGPDQLQPPATQGYAVGDFLKSGVTLSVSKRYLRGNQAIRCLAAVYSVPVIDAEFYWFETLEAAFLKTGSMVAAEGLVFNPGQNNHPNLLGIGGSYHRGNADLTSQLGQQGIQSAHQPRMTGHFGINLPGPSAVVFGPDMPGAIVDIYPPHWDVVTKPFSVKTNTGPVDGYGAPSPVEAWFVSPTRGDLVSPSCILGGAIGAPAFRAKDHLGRTEVRDRLSFYNLPSGSTLATYTLPDGMAGRFTLFATHPGVALSQRYRMEFSNNKGVIVQETGSPYQIGADTEFSVSISGLKITATVLIAGTSMHLTCDAF